MHDDSNDVKRVYILVKYSLLAAM